MTFARGQPKPANGGRKKGVRNKRTLAAEAKPDGLNHLIEVMTSTDPVITPDLKLRRNCALSISTSEASSVETRRDADRSRAAEDSPGGSRGDR
jgi:hypothetical protein